MLETMLLRVDEIELFILFHIFLIKETIPFQIVENMFLIRFNAVEIVLCTPLMAVLMTPSMVSQTPFAILFIPSHAPFQSPERRESTVLITPRMISSNPLIV